MANEHIKRCLSPVITKVQIKTTRRYDFIHTKMVLKKLKMPSHSENVEQLELSYITDGDVKWYNYFGKHFDRFL